MRKKIIAGNWKMNKTVSQAMDLIDELKDLADVDNVDVVFCPNDVALMAAVEKTKGSKIAIGAQNMFYEESGAYTGETSAEMLTDIGVKYVIIGHSERRAYFGETDQTVNKKVKKALDHKLVPIVCVGESLEQREQGITMELVAMQTKIAFEGISPEDAKKVIIAYEPIWAIGTGKTASSEQAEEVCKAIREVVASVYSDDVAQVVRIQYGGSVKAANAAELFAMPNIDGGLVGGASLSKDFIGVVKY